MKKGLFLSLTVAMLCAGFGVQANAAKLMFVTKDGKSVADGRSENIVFVQTSEYNDNGQKTRSLSIVDSIGRHCQIIQKSAPGVDFSFLTLNLLKSTASVWCKTSSVNLPPANSLVMAETIEISDGN